MRRRLLWVVCVGLLWPVMLPALASEGSCQPDSALSLGVSQHTIQVDERERSYILYVPPTYDRMTRMPLVLMFHGFASSAENVMGMTEFNSLADEQGFMVVYPQGSEQPSVWFNGVSVLQPRDDDRDMRFVEVLLDQAESDWCVDASRVYAVGFSMGGGMVHRLACEMSDRIAAIATVAGAFGNIPGGCNPTRPVPVLSIHGLEDPVVPFEGVPLLLPNVSQWVNRWAARNSCEGSKAQPTTDYLEGVRYDMCAEKSRVILVTIAEGGHTWPGTTRPNRAARLGGAVTSEVNATRLIWEFVSA